MFYKRLCWNLIQIYYFNNAQSVNTQYTVFVLIQVDKNAFYMRLFINRMCIFGFCVAIVYIQNKQTSCKLKHWAHAPWCSIVLIKSVSPICGLACMQITIYIYIYCLFWSYISVRRFVHSTMQCIAYRQPPNRDTYTKKPQCIAPGVLVRRWAM